MGPSLTGFGFLVVVILSVLKFDSCESSPLQEKEVEVLDGILKNYDTRVRPNGVNSSEANSPTVVNINTFIRTISKVDDFNMEFNIQLTFRQVWVDDRFKYSDLGHDIKYLTLNDPTKIWLPDIFFSNEIQGFVHDLITPNLFIRIYPDGNVVYSARVSMTLSCPMNLRWFPFDEQVCVVKMASYGYTTDDLQFVWKEEEPVQVNKLLHLPRFDLVSFATDTCHSATSTGSYSCLKLNLRLKREASYYVLNVLIPSAMLVIVSWISFWLDHSAIMGRVLIGVTTLLSLALKSAAFNATLAPVSYTKSIDVWTGICMAFIFAALLESASVNYLARSEEKKRRCTGVVSADPGAEEEMDLKPLVSPVADEPPAEGNGRSHTLRLKERACAYKKWMTKIPSCSKRLDIVSRVLFPLGFLLFVVVYALANAVHCNEVEA